MKHKIYHGLLLALTCVLLFKTNSVFPQSQVLAPCTLTDADQDTLRIFPDRTNYRTEFIRIDETGDKRGVGAERLYRELERRLNDKWDPVMESQDLPYVFYELLKGPDRIGWIFGGNQAWPGRDNCQIMCGFDLDGRVIEFYFQKIPICIRVRSWLQPDLESKEFYSQFIGLTLEHFYIHEQLENLKVSDVDILGLDMIRRMYDTTGAVPGGFHNTLRGMKLFFILLDDLKFNNKVKKEEVFAKTKYLVENKDKISLIGPNALDKIKHVFPEASRFTVDLISLKGRAGPVEELLGDKLDPI